MDPEASPAQAYDWLEVSKVLMRLYLLRRQAPDIAAGAALSEAVLRFVLRHFSDLDIRELCGWTPRSGPHDLRCFDAWEAIYGYADYAAVCLREVGQSTLADELGQALRSLGNSAEGPTLPWLTCTTGDLEDEGESNNEDGA